MPTISEETNKDGIRTYICIVRYKGQRVKKRFQMQVGEKNYKTKRAEALAWGYDIEKQIDEGIYKQEHKKHNYTVREAIEKYIADGNPKKSEKTRQTYIHCLEWFKKEIGTLPIKTLCRSDLKACRDKLKKKHKEIPIKNGKPKISAETISNTCVNRYLAYFSTFLSYCVDEYEIIDTNIMNGAKLKLKENEARQRWLPELQDRIKLLNCMKAYSTQAYIGTLIMLLTGARNSEVVKLTWKDTDFENRAIYLKDTKNGEDRTLAMPDVLYRELLEYKKQSKVRNIKNNYLFTNTKGEMNIELFYNKCNDIINDNGFNADNQILEKEGKLTMYNLRHTYTSIGAMLNINTDIMDKITGHRNGRMTARYTHAMCETVREPMNKIANYMLGIEKGQSFVLKGV